MKRNLLKLFLFFSILVGVDKLNCYVLHIKNDTDDEVITVEPYALMTWGPVYNASYESGRCPEYFGSVGGDGYLAEFKVNAQNYNVFSKHGWVDFYSDDPVATTSQVLDNISGEYCPITIQGHNPGNCWTKVTVNGNDFSLKTSGADRGCIDQWRTVSKKNGKIDVW